MEPIEIFTLVPSDHEAATSWLKSNGRDLGEVVGCVLEAQFRCQLGYIVVTSTGNPLEELAHIYLLGPDLHLMDVISLGAMYHSGAVRNLAPCSADCLEFSFFGGNDRWRLTIRNSSKVNLLPSIASSVSYPGGWLRPHYLQLTRM